MLTSENKTIQSSDTSNRNVPGKAPFFQPKLTINAPGDEYEQEADAMADKVMCMPVNDQPFFSAKPVGISHLQRKCAHCEEEEKLQRKENTTQPTEAGSETSSYIHSLSSKGSPLSKETRSFFEPRFGYDFSDVKVHTDAVAAKSAHGINALAYTSGINIVFNENQFSPESDSGKKLLAHELMHVVQQKGLQNTLFRKKDKTCAVRYKDKATKAIDKKTFTNQLAINVDSWTPFLIDKVNDIVNEMFSKKEEIGWFGKIGKLLIETGKELLDLTEIGEGLKVGMKIGGVFFSFLIEVCGDGQTISEADDMDTMKKKVAEATKKSLIKYQTDQLTEGNKFIESAFTGEMINSKEDCDKAIGALTNDVNEKFPRLTLENYDRIKEIAEELVAKASYIEHALQHYSETGETATEDRTKQYQSCLRQYFPENGMPTKEQEDNASEKCYYLTFQFPYEQEADEIIEHLKQQH